MVWFGILMAASVSAVSDDTIRQHAARCGLKADQLVRRKDAEGHTQADLTPNGDLDGFSFKSMRCLLDWAAKSGARIGFISEPPPLSQERLGVSHSNKRTCNQGVAELSAEETAVSDGSAKIRREAQ